MDAAPQDEGQELPSWLRPGQRVAPQEALRHIQGLCTAWPDLYAALFVVLATHQELPREVLAVAIKQFRTDLDAFTREDVVSLLTAVWNGGKSGFEAVLRTRVNSPKRAASLSWVKD